MTGYEEELVEQRLADDNTARLCNEIVARCLVAPGADHTAEYERVCQLPVPERDAALIAIRRLSLGDLVQSEATCPACSKRSTIDFRLSDLPLSWGPLPAEVEVLLPEGEGGTRIVMRLPTAKDQEDLLSARLATFSEKRTFLLARVMLRHGELRAPFEFEYARALPVGIRAKLEQAIEAALPTLDLSMGIRCAECGHEFSSPFDVAAFFLPR